MYVFFTLTKTNEGFGFASKVHEVHKKPVEVFPYCQEQIVINSFFLMVRKICKTCLQQCQLSTRGNTVMEQPQQSTQNWEKNLNHAHIVIAFDFKNTWRFSQRRQKLHLWILV